MILLSLVYAGLAQLVRAHALQAWGHWFESSTPHHRHLQQIPFEDVGSNPTMSTRTLGGMVYAIDLKSISLLCV